MSEANVRLRLDTADAITRLAKLAHDSDRMRTAWSDLPKDVREAHKALLRLSRENTRVGHLRRHQRHEARLHLEHVRRGHQAVRQELVGLHRQIAAHPSLGAYRAAAADGTLAAKARGDKELAGLHQLMQRRTALDAQAGALSSAQGYYRRWGRDGRFNPGAAAGYWGRRAAFGTNANGQPLTAGQWAAQGARQGVRRGARMARQAAGLFTAFQGIQTLVTGMEAFEHRATLIQELGAQMAGRFDGVGDALDRLRQRYKFTRGELGPAFGQLVRLTGSLGGAETAVRFARATGLAPGQVTNTLAEMAQYGRVNGMLLEGGLRGTGMRGRPDAYLSMLGGAQLALGRGYYQVPDDAALRYVGLTSAAMGDPYRGPRGRAFIGRLINGVRSRGDQMTHAIKLHAIRGLGSLDLGGGVMADTNTYRGMRMALESGDPRVLEALYSAATQHGGRGELGEEFFQKLTGLGAMESTRLFRSMGRMGGRVPEGAALQGHGLERDLAAVGQTEGYRAARVRADLEGMVYEPLGRRAVHVTEDFKEAAITFIEGLATATTATQALSAMRAAIVKTGAGASDPLTPLVRDATLGLSSNSLAGAAIKLGIAHGAELPELVGGVVGAVGEAINPSAPSSPSLFETSRDTLLRTLGLQP